METKRVLITGISGMDGSHLADLLLKKGYEIFGLIRRISQPNLKNIQHLIDNDSINLIGGDLADQASIINAINISKPEELYNLAAQSFVAASWQQAEYTSNITGLGALRVFEAARLVERYLGKKIKIYQASSSEQFGNVESPQNEDSPMRPRSPYAAAKVFAHNMARIYRDSYGMFISCGICFNHSSEKRGIEFVSRKISDGVARIKLGLSNELRLGNIESKRDWLYARDVVEAMWLMLQQDRPDDFVIASGENHSVKEFLEIAFQYAELDNWRDYVKIDEKFFRPSEVYELKGDYNKIKDLLGWKPKVSFRELVKIMVYNDIKELNI